MRRFFQKIRDGFIRFMYGRYGRNDAINMVILGLALIMDVVFMFTGFFVWYIISFLLVGLMLFRILSKNVQKRYNENQKFLNFFRRLKMLRKYHIYKCPGCRQKIRIPRKGGKRVEIRCPKCGQTFIKKI